MAGKTATLALKITGDASDAKRALGDTEDRAAKFGNAMKGAAIVGGAALLGLGAGMKYLYDAADESRKITALTEQVIKSTGGAAGVSAKQVGDLASAIAKKTGVDDEAIQSGQNLLLTFTNVKNAAGEGNDIFDQATRIMTDMSVALGTDATTSATQLGKALNDPIKGVSALQKVGVSFTEKQKEQIKTLVESGDTLSAQKIILKELGTEFGGAAEAASTPLDRLKQRAGDIAETLGGYLIPAIDTFSAFVGDKVIPVVSGWAETMGPKLLPIIQGVSTFVTDTLIPTVTSLWEEIGPKLGGYVSAAADLWSTVLLPAFNEVWAFIRDYVVPIVRDTLGPALDGATTFVTKLKDAVVDNKDKFKEMEDQLRPFLDWMRDDLAPFIGGTLKWSFEKLGDAIGPFLDALMWINDHKELMGVFGNISKVREIGNPFNAPNPAAGGGTGGGLFGAAPGGGALFAASSSLGGGGAGPSTTAGGLRLGGDTYQITVTGALDPVAVADQIGRLLDARARRTGAAAAFGRVRIA